MDILVVLLVVIFLIVQTYLLTKQQDTLTSRFINSIREIQIEHFKTLDDSVSKERTSLLSHMKTLQEMALAGDRYFEMKTPVKKSKNSIEEINKDEIEITENMRVPIMNGTKVKFEDEDRIDSVSLE